MLKIRSRVFKQLLVKFHETCIFPLLPTHPLQSVSMKKVSCRLIFINSSWKGIVFRTSYFLSQASLKKWWCRMLALKMYLFCNISGLGVWVFLVVGLGFGGLEGFFGLGWFFLYYSVCFVLFVTKRVMGRENGKPKQNQCILIHFSFAIFINKKKFSTFFAIFLPFCSFFITKYVKIHI